MNLTKLMSMSPVQQANVVAAIDASRIPGRELKRKFARIQKKQAGFTLLELLVVVAILAVLGGLAIGAYGDKTTQAARGASTNTIAAVDSMVRAFQATARVLPDDLDTLVCSDPTAVNMTTGLDTSDFGGGSDLPGVSGGMGAKMAGKVERLVLPDNSKAALANAGIARLRYGVLGSCADSGNVASTPIARADADFGAGLNAIAPVAYPSGNLSAADIPTRAFDFPISATGNRGRGFVVSHTDNTGAVTGNDVVVQVWSPGANGTNNTKVGAAATDVLAVFGLGNNATMYTNAGGANRVGASSPFYGDLAKDKYSRYMGLFKVGTDANFTPSDGITALSASSKASFITVVDPRGDFLDEEYAEAIGQKV